jgi:mannosyl-oligosaccharide alpha-1,3-glucosidase
MSVNMLLSLGVSGIVFGGCDIPGFYGEPSDDLFIQFYQLGAYYPFMRAHNNIPRNLTQDVNNFSRREPWLQSERIQAVIKASVLQRYQQIHYLYTQYYYANTEGLPIMRPMWMEFPTDTNTFSLGNQFMWGDSFLVAPKLGEPVKFSMAMNGIYNITVYLPPSADWYLQQNK